VRANKEECQALWVIISCYEATSGKQIYKDKSEVVFSRNVRDDQTEAIRSELQTVETNYHAKYLGLPTIFGRSKKAVFEGIKQRIWKKLQGYKERLLSQPGKEILLKSIAQVIPTYAMSIFKLPDTLLEKLYSLFANFWWGSTNHHKRMHWQS